MKQQKMLPPTVQPLADHLQEAYEDEIYKKIVIASDVELGFILHSRGVYIQVTVACIGTQDGWTTSCIEVFPYIDEGDTLRLYDLHLLRPEDMTVLSDLQTRVEWGILYFTEQDGAKYPALKRKEFLDSSLSFDDQDFPKLVFALEMMIQDVVAITPVLAALASATPLNSELVLLSLMEVDGEVH